MLPGFLQAPLPAATPVEALALGELSAFLRDKVRALTYVDKTIQPITTQRYREAYELLTEDVVFFNGEVSRPA